MAPLPKSNNTIEHFTHPGHRLVMFSAAPEYRCDGCKTTGTGSRFRCNPCDFDLHEYCATCPTTLSSFMHPHPLNLVLRKTLTTRTVERVCDVCRDGINGLFYRCKDCDFDVHPLCTQLPQNLRHPLHPLHPLIFRQSGSGWCRVCGGACGAWRYSCGNCGFDIHLGCVLVYGDLLKQRTVPSFNIPPVPPQVGGYGFGQTQAAAAYGGWVQGQLHAPPAYGGYGYGVPSGSGLYSNYANQVNGSGVVNGSGSNNTSMFALVGKLTLGVLNNVDLSSFM